MLAAGAILAAACDTTPPAMASPSSTRDSGDPFAGDVAFLQQHGEVIELRAGAARVAVMPALQGRVMTSTTGGGDSFGWINRACFADVAAGKVDPHMHAFGGEDRFWLGPEGGQFSVFFQRGEPFDFEHWRTPAFLDTEPFPLVSRSADRAMFRREVAFANHSGTPFHIRIDREVRVLAEAAAWQQLGMPAPPGVRLVAFETDNRVTNIGDEDWRKERGLLSIWILSMLHAGPRTTVVVPIVSGPESELGQRINDDYFGKVPADRLAATDHFVFFKADGNKRSKIGTAPRRTKPVLGSYDAAAKVLTLAQFSFDPRATDYVNSAWRLQDAPYGGDVVNSYNDGPNDSGTQMGKFYELETSSAAHELRRGESMRHVHRTIHLAGDENALDAVSRAVLGVGCAEIAAALAGR